MILSEIEIKLSCNQFIKTVKGAFALTLTQFEYNPGIYKRHLNLVRAYSYITFTFPSISNMCFRHFYSYLAVFKRRHNSCL